MAAVTRRQYKGAAAQTTITNALAAGDTSATLAATTGWPSTAAVPFYVVISPGTSSEEKCLATISGSVLTLTRAQDDTTAQSHASGATIYPVFTADDADEANKLASTMTTRGDLLTMGSGPDFARIAIGASGRVLKSDGTDAAWAVDPATDLVTTKGDVLVATAADTLARLPVGINGYRLTAASGETTGLKYDMPSVPVFADSTARDAAFGGAGEKTLAEGQLCYLESTNVVQYYDGAAWATLGPTSSGLAVVQAQTTETAAATVTDDGVFTSTYRNYLIVGSFSTSSTGTVGVQLRASGSTTATNYGWQRLTANDGTVSGARATAQTSWTVALATNGAFNAGFAFYIYQPQIAASTPFWFQYNQQSGDNTGSLVWESRTGNQNSSTQFDGIIWTPSTGTITMTYTIYGFGTT